MSYIFYKEADIVIDFTIKNNDTGALVDPSTLVIETKIYDADNLVLASRNFTYGVDSELTRSSLGTFKLIFAPTHAGRFVYAIKTTGPKGYDKDALIVKENAI